MTGLCFFAIVATSTVFVFIIQDSRISLFNLSIYFFCIFFCTFWHLIIFLLHSNPSCKLKRHLEMRFLYFFRLFFFINSFCFLPFCMLILFSYVSIAVYPNPATAYIAHTLAFIESCMRQS